MEDLEESFRLDQKTDSQVVERQARWAGLQPGMRVADLGCGSGKTTSVLHKMVKPGGEAIGVDFSPSRCEFANTHYSSSGVRFVCRDVRDPLDDLGTFDFLWVRFLLEYYLSGSFEIVKHLSTILKPGGILCLIDLDQNCLNHYGMTEKLEKTLLELSILVQTRGNFDPWAGRKLYSFLYDLEFEQLSVEVSAHHLIFGPLNETDAFNWLKKVEVAPQKIQYDFKEYNGSHKDFLKEFSAYFRNPRRFIYTPVIACRGIKPGSFVVPQEACELVRK
jgi:ubiquinone/menaquinone biosynthesis C-methylase UbiE